VTNEAPSSPTTTLRTTNTSVDVTETLGCSESTAIDPGGSGPR
jgi:hypothetical protein